MPKRLILCDCSGTQAIDAKLIDDLCDVTCSRVYSNLCTTQIDLAAREMSAPQAIIACLQEQTRFGELAEETGTPMPGFVDLRDRAGWSGEGAETGPKMVALIREALLPQAPVKMSEIQSRGRCLILGAGETALAAAGQLAEMLAVTVLLPEPPDMLSERRFDVVTGRIRQVGGGFGGYDVTIDALRQLTPGGRGGLRMGAPRDGGRSECDLILDLSGAMPLFSGHGRDGYLRADPRDAQAVAGAVLAASHLLGSFEKPLYVKNTPHLCAHSRAGISGCRACIDNCASGAIRPDGDHVSIDPDICAGCGDCVALCPSGALSFEAPPTEHLFKRIQTLAEGYSSAGGINPTLLVHDGGHGAEMISLAARFGRGLPGGAIPLELESTALFGHAEMLAALGVGFARVDMLGAAKSACATQEAEAALANIIAGGTRVRLLAPMDPDALGDALWNAPTPALPGATGATGATILAQGSRRQIARLGARALNPDSQAPIPLPDGAPYGVVTVDAGACTLCLACVSLCPSGALSDNPEQPQLRFVEDACLQCGICATACPENALGLRPRLDLSDDALNPVVLHEEEPFACISCGTLFGVKSTVDKIISLLEGKHPMFADSDAGRLIRMCDDCRVEAQYHSEEQPFQAAPRPKTVTTEDYFSKRKDH